MDLSLHKDFANLAATRASIDNTRKNMLATIMSVDLVSHSPPTAEQLLANKKLLDQLLASALAKVDGPFHIEADDLDGIAFCFTGDPKEALDSARLLRDLLQIKRYGQQGSIRIGLHFGMIRVMKAVNRRLRVAGDGINIAQRIMNFSQDNQIIASQPYYEIVSSASERASAKFVHIGERTDREQRSHNLYVVVDSNIVRSPIAINSIVNAYREKTPLGTESIKPGWLTEDQQSQIERALAKYVGPFAKALVRKEIALHSTFQELLEALAQQIDLTGDRHQFLAIARKTYDGKN